MKYENKHEYSWHRETPERLAALRNYYIGTGLRGVLSSVHVVIEFIEAYAEIKGWDLDNID